MSVSLYPRRVYWDGRHGCIRNGAALTWLEAPPQIVRGQRVIEVDYAPGVVAQLREHAGPMRDMRPAEIEACDALIASIALEPQP